MFELAKEPEIGFWCGFEPHKSIKDSLFVLHNFLEIKGAFAVCLKENGRIVGSIGLHFKEDTYLTSKDDECELGYWIGMPYWRNGYATEAVTRVLEYAFADLNVSTIWSSHYDGNYKSKSVLEKLGFVFHHISSGADINKTKMTHIYKLTKEKWISLNK